jgi:hypothetical protein
VAEKAASRRPRQSYVQIGDQYIKLPRSRVLKIGALSLDFRGGGEVLGFESHCCKSDLADCVKKTGVCPEDRPITVFK